MGAEVSTRVWTAIKPLNLPTRSLSAKLQLTHSAQKVEGGKFLREGRFIVQRKIHTLTISPLIDWLWLGSAPGGDSVSSKATVENSF